MTCSASVSILTPSGRGAIAVVRVWGKAALSVADAAFRPNSGPPLTETPRGRLRLGRMGAGIGDEVVAVVTAADPPEVEVQCHGGPLPEATIVEALTAGGAEVVPAEFWVVPMARSPLAAQAMVDLARAPTVRAADVLMDQANGALDVEIRGIIQAMERGATHAIARLDGLIERSGLGLRLLCGWRVVLAGRPNVGKSRLLNALAGYERSIVSALPGTTRDVVAVRSAIDGWPVELSDTAGVRRSADPIESAGVAMARSRHAEADLVVLVLDRSDVMTDENEGLLASLPDALQVANKSDLPAAWDASSRSMIEVSAARGDGVDRLLGAIAGRLTSCSLPDGAAVPFRKAQQVRLARARALAAAGRFGPAIRALQALRGTDNRTDPRS